MKIYLTQVIKKISDLQVKKLLLLLLPFLCSCSDDQWKVTSINKLLKAKNIDTAQYSTLEELYSKGEVGKINTYDVDSISNYRHFYYPLVRNDEFVYIEKGYSPDRQKNVLIKLNREGIVLDSIIINKQATFINDDIIEKDFYCSWLVDGDKRIKKLENINWFSFSDTSKIKSLIQSFKKTGEPYYFTSEYSSDERIDTCNYIISFKNNKLVKYNFLKSISPEYDLKLSPDNVASFSAAIKPITTINSEDIFKVDNFFAKSHQTFIPGNKFEFKLYPNGGGLPPCNTYEGTCYFTLASPSKIKLRMEDQSICENRNLNELGMYHKLYSSSGLNIFLFESGIQNAVYYVIKK